jgi:hypothetical protein
LPAVGTAAARALRRRVRRLALLRAAEVLLAMELGDRRGARAAGELRRRERAVVGGLGVIDVRRWAERAAKARSQDGRPVLAFDSGARDAGAGADGTLAGLLDDERAVRTRRRGTHRGRPATGPASRARSRRAARAAGRRVPTPVVRRPGNHAGAVPRRLQRPPAAGGDADHRDRNHDRERPDRPPLPTPGRRASVVSRHHEAHNDRVSRPGKGRRGGAEDPRKAKVRALAATRPNSNPRHRRFVWRTAVQSLNSRTPKRPRE